MGWAGSASTKSTPCCSSSQPGVHVHVHARASAPCALHLLQWHPTAPSHISTAAHSLAVARQAADDKVLKFADQIRASRHCEHFLPVAIETYGGLEPRAVDLLRLIAAHGAAQSPLTQGEIMAHLVDGITVALHKGNYELLQSARRAL